MPVVATRERGCGLRIAGALYWELEIGSNGNGVPVANFLLDPPIPINMQALGMTEVGVKLIERAGVWHVLDWIGEAHYPNVADFIEEAQTLGVSRRMPIAAPLQRLTADSRLLCVHRRAYIGAWQAYRPQSRFERHRCVHGHIPHQRGTEGPCLWTVYQDLSQAGVEPGGVFTRRLPCGAQVTGYQRPSGVDPQYQSAIFASFPLTRLALVADRVSAVHEAAERTMTARGQPFTLVEA
jgi:hypothetical protein